VCQYPAMIRSVNVDTPTLQFDRIEFDGGRTPGRYRSSVNFFVTTRPAAASRAK
jgi:hypothetical protein